MVGPQVEPDSPELNPCLEPSSCKTSGNASLSYSVLAYERGTDAVLTGLLRGLSKINVEASGASQARESN